MAQKTPLPAKTIMYADRWNGTWFIEMENFRTQLMVDYHLRFLITGFLRLKRQWLLLLLLNKSNGFYFLKVSTVNYIPNVILKPTIKKRSYNSILKKKYILKVPSLALLNKASKFNFKKKKSTSFLKNWLKLQKKGVIQNTNSFANFKEKYSMFPTVKLNKSFRRNRSFQKNKSFRRNRSFLPLQLQNRKFSMNSLQLLKQIKYKPKLINAYKDISFVRKDISIYQNLSFIASYFNKRMFRYSQDKTIKKAFKLLIKKKGFQLKFKRLQKRIATSVLFLNRAIYRVIRLRFFFSYVPIEWSLKDYKPLKKFLVFEGYGNQKYFVSSFSVLHVALSRGSSVLLTDLLVNKLRSATRHTDFLKCVERICRYFMVDFSNNKPHSYSICKGIEIVFRGKVNGKERSSMWRFKLGPVHTSTFYTNTREENAKCITRYGAFHIRVRLKLGLLH